MNALANVTPNQLAVAVLLSGMSFVALWYLDHKTHLTIWKRDITDGELMTHRMILYASYVLLGSLVLMAWLPGLALPLFVGAWVTRTLHEGIDELRWHGRCTERETLIHLGMWVSVHMGTAAMFGWAWFFRYEGIQSLPFWMYPGFALTVGGMMVIGRRELLDYRGPRDGSVIPEAREATSGPEHVA